MTAPEIITLLFQFAVVSAVAFVVICLLASLLRFQGMATSALEYDASDTDGDDAFHAYIARSISRRVGEARPFCVGLMNWSGSSEVDTRQEVIDSIRGHLRPGDHVFQLESGRVGLVLALPASAISALFDRLREGLPVDSTVGLSAFPGHGDRLDPLLEQARGALAEAAAGTVRLAGEVDPASPSVEPQDNLADIAPDQRQYVDPVSGLLREGDVAASAQKLVATARRYGDPVSVLAFGIEHADRYHEHYGSDGVDAMRAHVGRILRTGVRENDMPGQLPGLQFTIVLFTDLDRAQRIARRLVEAVRTQPCPVAANRLPLTLNCGIAGYPDHGQTGKQLLQRARVALRRAGVTGRGSCLVYSAQQDAGRPSLRDTSQEKF